MVQIQVRYEGSLRCAAVHGPSSDRLHTDAPVDNGGRGAAFSPTDLVATALLTCMLTIVGKRAEQNGWDVSGMHGTVEKSMVADPLRRIGRLAIAIHVPAELDAEARAALGEAARTCPVSQCLDPRIETPLELRFGAGAAAGS